MMTLPNFEQPNPTTEELRAEQARLHVQADSMLAETGITDVFAKYGKVSPISGSYAYGLMVYPDLDMDIVAEQVTKQDFARLVGELAASSFVRKVSTADTVNFTSLHTGRPKGYWLGLEIPFQNDRWGVDVWLQSAEWAQNNDDTYQERLAILSQEQTAAILAIKYQLIRRGLYGNRFFSNTVYDAVLDSSVLSFADFATLHKIS